MTKYLIFNDFLDFKKKISIRSLGKGRREDWYDVSLIVNAKVSRYYILRAILELIMYGNKHKVIMYNMHIPKTDYDRFLLEIKSIVGMSNKTVVFMRQHREYVEKKFKEYFSSAAA